MIDRWLLTHMYKCLFLGNAIQKRGMVHHGKEHKKGDNKVAKIQRQLSVCHSNNCGDKTNCNIRGGGIGVWVCVLEGE